MEKQNKGFMLVETLIVTMVVSGILLFLFIQFSNLSKSYEESFTYNTTEDLFSLNNLKIAFESNYDFLEYLDDNLIDELDMTTCKYIEDVDRKEECEKLIETENIDLLVITKNAVNMESLQQYPSSFVNFAEKISETGTQEYRMIASFSDSTFATVRFGD